MNYLGKLVVAVVLTGLAAGASAHNFSSLYFFGDSLSDAGNVALAIGTDPDQVITGNDYIPSKPYASGQFTDNDVWAITFAKALGLTPFAEPALSGGGNFAFGGARTGMDDQNLSPSLIAQGGMFLNASGGIAPQDGLYILQSGGNDVRDALAAIAAGSDPETVIETTTTQYTDATGTLVDQLQAAGAQRIVVWNVPNIGLSPAIIDQGTQASLLAEQLAITMNSALTDRMSSERGVTIFDDFGLITDAAMNPAQYDLINATDACGAVLACDPSTYLFWDGIHPTSIGHTLLAQQMIQTIPEPATYALLIAGLAVIVARLRRQASG